MAGIELDGANQKVVLDADGDTYLEAATDDTIKVYVAGAHDATISANAINVLSGTTLTIDSGATITNSGTANGFSSANPASADGDTLGTASLEWSDLFLADGGTIQFGNDQDVLLTHVADTGLLLSGTNVIQFNDASQNIGAPSATVLDINATDEIELNATAVDLNGTLDVSGTSLLTGRVGVVTAGDLGVGIHVRSADSGASVDGGADELIVENNGAAGISILTANDATGKLAFGDDGAAAKFSVNYDHSTDLMKINTEGAIAIQMDQNGHVTMPLQSCFSVTHNVSQTNLTEEQQNTITFGNEVFDVNADFASNTFTAPVTGKYLLTAKLSMAQIDHDGTYYSNITINTSNRNYKNAYSVRDFFEAQPEFFVFTCTCIADMDASDTAVVEFGTYGPGASQEDVYGTSADATQFMGQLIS